MILCFDFDLIGCKDLANGSGGDEVRHFVSQGDKTRFLSPTPPQFIEAGAALCNPIAKRKAYICSVLPRRQRFLAGRFISIAPRSAPGSQLRGSLGETSAVPSRRRPAASPRSQRLPEPTPPTRRTPPMKRDENTRPSTPSSDTSSALGTPFPLCGARPNDSPFASPPSMLFIMSTPLRSSSFSAAGRCVSARVAALAAERAPFFIKTGALSFNNAPLSAKSSPLFSCACTPAGGCPSEHAHDQGHDHGISSTSCGCGCSCGGGQDHGGESGFSWHDWRRPIAGLLLALAAWGLLRAVPALAPWERLLYLPAYICVSLGVWREAGESLRRGDFFNEFTLMLIATVGALALGDCPEAVGVMLFYLVGETLQGLAVGRARADIASVAALRPDHCTMVDESDDTLREVDPKTVACGTVLHIERGARLPLDGVLLTPVLRADTSALTGESAPRTFAAGDELAAGVIALDRAARIRVTKPYGEDALSRIMHLVEEAAERKAPAEQMMTRIARVYTPVVVALAALLAAVPTLLAAVRPDWGIAAPQWWYRALVFLVASCPCALVLSVPLSYFRGIGVASRRGILFKGSLHLDRAADIDTVVFDKTGTLTHGVVTVADGVDSGTAGAFTVSDDRTRTSAFAAVKQLRRSGMHTVVLSGDERPKVEALARELALDEWHAELLPADKLTALEALIDGGRRTAYVGDGVNDAPVLARAHVGFAMGAGGTDAAVDTADAVLATDDLRRVADALHIARRTRRLVWTNVLLAVGIKLLVLILSAFGLAGMWAAVFADTGVVLLCVALVLLARFPSGEAQTAAPVAETSDGTAEKS